MTTGSPRRTVAARPFPHGVPNLVDPVRGVRLRAHLPDDAADTVVACRDLEVIRWTSVPVPATGYALGDALAFIEVVADGWRSGERLTWVIEAERAGRRRFCGSIHLLDDGSGACEVGFLLHPEGRGRSLMSTALRLVRDWAFDVAGFEVIRWRALVGNWGSRRVAAAAGFVFDGTVRRCLPHRGALVDAWVATICADDPRGPLTWSDPPVLSSPRLRLRLFSAVDLDRIVEACTDARTRQWLVSLPQPYGRSDALDYVELTREHAARGTGSFWCIASADDDRYLGSISLDGLTGYSRRAEIGYLAHPEARGAGIVTEAVRMVTSYAEEAGLVDSIVIRCAAGNRASRHVATQAGYAQAGVLPDAEPVGTGELADLVLYSRP